MTLKQFNIRNLLKELFKAVEFYYRHLQKDILIIGELENSKAGKTWIKKKYF